MNLRLKIALALAAIACAATAAVGLVGYRTTSARLIDEIDRSIEQASRALVARPRPERLPARGALEIYQVRLLGPDGAPTRSEFTVEAAVTPAAVAITGEPGRVVRETVDTDDGPMRLHTYGAQGGALQVGRGLDEVDRVLTDLRRRTLLLVAVVAAAAAALGWLIASSVAAPLRRLTRAAAEVESTGRLDVDVPAGGRDEVGVLGGAFAGMLAALSRSRDAQQRLVQDAGHELRTPLTSLRTNLAVLRRHDALDPEMKRRILDDLDGEVGELTDLVNELVAAASGSLVDQPAARIVLADVVEQAATRVGRRRGREITVRVEGPAATVLAPPAAVDRAVANVVDNACKFDAGGGLIEVVVAAGTVRVLDRGPGIPVADLAHVFDRFHRSEEARALPGSGLGLAIVRQIVDRHGGSTHAVNRPEGGAEVGFSLPVVA